MVNSVQLYKVVGFRGYAINRNEDDKVDSCCHRGDIDAVRLELDSTPCSKLWRLWRTSISLP